MKALIDTTTPTHRLRLSERVWQRLRAHHLASGKRQEAISLAFGHVHEASNGSVLIVLAREDGLMLFDEDCYEHRSHGAAVLRRDVRAQALWQAMQQGWTAVVDIHDHHFARLAAFSSTDDRDDKATHDYFTRTLPAFSHNGRPPAAAALLLAQEEARARLVAHGTSADWGAPMRIDVVGATGLVLPGVRAPEAEVAATPPGERMSRHAGVIPAAVQTCLADLHVGLIGCGGTGSIAAEALARMGVGQLTLVDDDVVENSNLNRLQGFGPADVGRPKAEVIAERLRAVLPETLVQACKGWAHEEAGRTTLPIADVLFGCLDNAESRWWINRMAVQYLQPWFDLGVVIEAGEQPKLLSRLNTIVPGAGPCGHCSPMEFFPRGRPEAFLDPIALAAQRSAGYVSGSKRRSADPSLYALNLAAVGLAVQEFASWACGRSVAHSLVQVMPQGLMQRLDLDVFEGNSASDCPVCQVLLGAADHVPLPQAGSTTTHADLPQEGDQLAAELAALFSETYTFTQGPLDTSSNPQRQTQGEPTWHD